MATERPRSNAAGLRRPNLSFLILLVFGTLSFAGCAGSGNAASTTIVDVFIIGTDTAVGFAVADAPDLPREFDLLVRAIGVDGFGVNESLPRSALLDDGEG